MSGWLDRVVVVGASVAGVAVVETLRRLGFDGLISLVSDETPSPYDRPPLSPRPSTACGWTRDWAPA
ncbi:FAD-dependent oxidoreductase [Nocardia sp. NPDC004711]